MWILQNATDSTKIGFQNFFCSNVINDAVLFKVTYTKKLYSVKIGFESFFLKKMFLWIMEYFLGWHM